MTLLNASPRMGLNLSYFKSYLILVLNLTMPFGLAVDQGGIQGGPHPSDI